MLNSLRRLRRKGGKGKPQRDYAGSSASAYSRTADSTFPLGADAAAYDSLSAPTPSQTSGMAISNQKQRNSRRPRLRTILRPKNDDAHRATPFRMRTDPSYGARAHSRPPPVFDDKRHARERSAPSSPARKQKQKPTLQPIDDEFDDHFDRELARKVGEHAVPKRKLLDKSEKPSPVIATKAKATPASASLHGTNQMPYKLSSRGKSPTDPDDKFHGTPPPYSLRREAEISHRNASIAPDVNAPAPSRHRPVAALRFARRHRSAMPSAAELDRAVPDQLFPSDGIEDFQSSHSINSAKGKQSSFELTVGSNLVKAGSLRFNSLNTHYGHNNPPQSEIKNSTNPMRPLLVSDARRNDKLRPSMSAPHPSVRAHFSKHSKGGGSFWFVDRRKPKSRLLSAFSLRKSSKLGKNQDPPPIASTPEIPWATPGALSDDSSSSDNVNPNLSTSFLSFRPFAQRSRTPGTVPHSSLTASGDARGAGLRRLRFPFSVLRPVPESARKEVTVMEEELEKNVAANAARPSDLSSINPSDNRDNDDHASDPPDSVEEEYSSLHSALAALMIERSAAGNANDSTMGEDISFGTSNFLGWNCEENEEQIGAGKTRYESTGAPVSATDLRGCAFSGPVLAFSLSPQTKQSRTSDVPPAPLVYGPASIDMANVLSEFSDPLGTGSDSPVHVVGLQANSSSRTAHSVSATILPDVKTTSPKMNPTASDEALVPESTSYIRVSSVGISPGVTAQKGTGPFSFARELGSLRSDDNNNGPPSKDGQHSVPVTAGAFEIPPVKFNDDDAPPLANSMDTSRLYADVNSNELQAPTAANVRLLARTNLPDVVPRRDAVMRRPLPSEATFTTFSDNRDRNDGGRSSLELASDIPSLSSDMLIDPPGTISEKRLGRPREAELNSSPSPDSGWRTREEPQSKAGIVLRAPLRDPPKPVPRAATATVLPAAASTIHVSCVVERDVTAPWSPSDPLVTPKLLEHQVVSPKLTPVISKPALLPTPPASVTSPKMERKSQLVGPMLHVSDFGKQREVAELKSDKQPEVTRSKEFERKQKHVSESIIRLEPPKPRIWVSEWERHAEPSNLMARVSEYERKFDPSKLRPIVSERQAAPASKPRGSVGALVAALEKRVSSDATAFRPSNTKPRSSVPTISRAQ